MLDYRAHKSTTVNLDYNFLFPYKIESSAGLEYIGRNQKKK